MLVSRQVHDRKGCMIAQQFSTHRKSHSSSFILLFLVCFWAVVWLFVHRETCEMVHHFELLCDNAIFHSSLGDFTGATQDANSHRFVVYREERGPVLVSSPALHGWEEAQSSRQRAVWSRRQDGGERRTERSSQTRKWSLSLKRIYDNGSLHWIFKYQSTQKVLEVLILLWMH